MFQFRKVGSTLEKIKKFLFRPSMQIAVKVKPQWLIQEWSRNENHRLIRRELVEFSKKRYCPSSKLGSWITFPLFYFLFLPSPFLSLPLSFYFLPLLCSLFTFSVFQIFSGFFFAENSGVALRSNLNSPSKSYQVSW